MSGEPLAVFGADGRVLIVSSSAQLTEEELDVTADPAAVLGGDPLLG